jgi:diguanylate cyclase (GGDEF)-like protein/PAS domain S-box-containing protein
MALMAFDGTYEAVNPAYCGIYGYSEAELVGQNVTLVFPPEKRTWVLGLHKQFLTDGGTLGGEWEVVRRDGTTLHVITQSAALNGADGTKRRLVYITDITTRRQIEQQLRDTLAKNQSLLSAISDLVFTNHRNGKYLGLEAADPQLLMVPSESFIGRNVQEILPAQLAGVFLDAFAKALDTLHVQEVSYSLPIGRQERHFEARIAPSANDTVITIVRDVTEKKLMEEQLRSLAFQDPLTQLANRRLMFDRLSQAIAASNRHGYFGALMFLDLDNFKSLNDTRGHDVGDQLLLEVAKRLRTCVREMDSVARFGGDEFVVMVSELDADYALAKKQATLVAEKIRDALSSSYVLVVTQEDQAENIIEHLCTSSIGVALFGKHRLNQKETVRYADMAMFQAKSAGKNAVRFWDPPNQ